MQYVGILTQQRRNNQLSALLLVLFPLIILGIVLLFYVILYSVTASQYSDNSSNYYADEAAQALADESIWPMVGQSFVQTVPWVLVVVGVWFIVSYFANVSMVRKATGAHSLERRDNPRIYNLVENLCIGCGMKMPKINIINDSGMNAFASGIDEKSYTVTLTTGIIDYLDDAELEGVIAHELTHIRNRDTRLLIISIIFVGILATAAGIIWRVMWYVPRRSSSKKDSGAAVLLIMLIALACCGIGYLFTILTRFAISRKREFMADAGGAELTRNPQALASALRKISGNPGLTETKREDVAQLFIFHQSLNGSFFNKLFSTHPDINERIRILEQF